MRIVSTDRSRLMADTAMPRLSYAPKILIAAGAAALLTAFGWGRYVAGAESWMHSYLISYCFFLSIALGALFFVLLQHLTNAQWSVATRRIAEVLTFGFPVLALLSVPIVVPLILGSSDLYEWNDARLRSQDPLIRGKAAYLNAPFFTIRSAVYFLVWVVTSKVFANASIRQDSRAMSHLSAALRQKSGPAMIGFAVTVNFAAFDWIMSLDPHWFSTIFGIYFFAGSAVAFFAALPICVATAQKLGYVRNVITIEHYHDMGKLLFGFTMFWAYIAFSQYLLIWYANIPEETTWFLVRQQEGWQYVSLLLVLGHFVLPFCGLMSRSARRNRTQLVFWSAFLLVMHWIDLFWLVTPNLSAASVRVGLTDVLCFVGIGVIWIGATLRRASGIRLVPQGDPRIAESLAFKNH